MRVINRPSSPATPHRAQLCEQPSANLPAHCLCRRTSPPSSTLFPSLVLTLKFIKTTHKAIQPSSPAEIETLLAGLSKLVGLQKNSNKHQIGKGKQQQNRAAVRSRPLLHQKQAVCSTSIISSDFACRIGCIQYCSAGNPSSIAMTCNWLRSCS